MQCNFSNLLTVALGITGLTTIAQIFCVCLSCSRPAQDTVHHFANGRPVAFCGRSYCGSLKQFAKRSVEWPFARALSAGSLSNVLFFITLYQQQKCEHLGRHLTIQLWKCCTVSVGCVTSTAENGRYYSGYTSSTFFRNVHNNPTRLDKNYL